MKGMLIYFDVIPGRQEEFERATIFHINNIRERDRSYLLYSLARIKDSDTRYVLVQRFESWETQLAHQTYDYVLAAMPAMNACLAGPPTVECLDIID
jgi:quinol monooxygenase YgiN